MKKVTFVTTTLTYANKGSDILQAGGITALVKRVQSTAASGCLFGITVASNDAKEAEAALERNQIKIISVRDD